jgi:nitrite reductase/ring-hydroxylating ferredoxin subunit
MACVRSCGNYFPKRLLLEHKLFLPKPFKGFAMSMDTGRRDFLTRLFTGVVVAGTTGKALGQIIPRIIETDSPNTIQAEYEIDLSLAKYANLLQEYSSVSITGTGISAAPIIVMRVPTDSFVALENSCTHEGGRMGTFSKSNMIFTCSSHGATFDSTGKHKSGPGGGALKSFPVTYDKANNKLILNRLTDVRDLTPDAYTVRCYPNPASTETVFEFGVESAGHVSLEVFDTRGTLVASVANTHMEAGVHQIPFSVEKLAAGSYTYSLRTHQGFVTVRHLNVVR